MTPRQRDVLLYVQGYIDAHGYSPSRREIAEGIGTASLQQIQDAIRSLGRHGYLRNTPYTRRNLEVLRREANAVAVEYIRYRLAEGWGIRRIWEASGGDPDAPLLREADVVQAVSREWIELVSGGKSSEQPVQKP